MTRLQGLAIAIALTFAPAAVLAQDAPADAPSYDGAQNVDSQGRRIDGDERYDDARYDGERYEVERYDDERGDRYDRDRRYDGRCNRKPDHATPVLGFTLGGLLGNQFGHGTGRALATAAGAHLGHEIARDAANNCDDYYRPSRRYGRTSFGLGYSGGGWRSGYSVYIGSAPYSYGFGYPGEYWRYRYRASPWRWHHH